MVEQCVKNDHGIVMVDDTGISDVEDNIILNY